MKRTGSSLGCALIVFVSLLAHHAFAQDSYYNGKTVRFIVGFSAGGGYDTYTRLISRHLGKHDKNSRIIRDAHGMPQPAGIDGGDDGSARL